MSEGAQPSRGSDRQNGAGQQSAGYGEGQRVARHSIQFQSFGGPHAAGGGSHSPVSSLSTLAGGFTAAGHFFGAGGSYAAHRDCRRLGQRHKARNVDIRVIHESDLGEARWKKHGKRSLESFPPSGAEIS